ncbi:hypothetical protein Plhal304r1_c015g0054701 [Plasmopara halstedii]
MGERQSICFVLLEQESAIVSSSLGMLINYEIYEHLFHFLEYVEYALIGLYLRRKRSNFFVRISVFGRQRVQEQHSL